MTSGASASLALDALAEEVFTAQLARDPYTAATSGMVVEAFPRGDLAEAEAAGSAARERLARLDVIDSAGLDVTERATVGFLRHWLGNDIGEADRWLTGFGVTPYSISGFTMMLEPVFGSIDLTRPEEGERFASLANDYAAAIVAQRERLDAQAARGWRVPRPAIAGARTAIAGVHQAARAALGLTARSEAPAPLREAMERWVETQLDPAFAKLAQALDDDYASAASDAVGMVGHPGGSDAYRRWMAYHLSFDADPEAIQARGLSDVADLAERMCALRSDAFGFDGDEDAFHGRLRDDARAKVASAAELETTFDRHLARMAPVFARLVRHAPRASARVERLPPAMEAGMTFGYYEAPTRPCGDGVYYYSANGVPDRLQLNAAPLIFHELVPGHHVAITRQLENEALPPLRRRTFAFSAFNEGWAEYSAGLAEENGLYDDPYDLYGWLSHQRFVAQRLVVDTGLNHYGWSLDEARAYMSANTLESAAQIASETLRYATDLPAQALAYRVGFHKFRDIREKARGKLGAAFDLRDFHEAILEQGCLPIAVLEDAIGNWVSNRLARRD